MTVDCMAAMTQNPLKIIKIIILNMGKTGLHLLSAATNEVEENASLNTVANLF